MLIQAEKPISARMDQWTRSLSKVALQSQICVKSRAIPLSGAVLNWLSKPTAGQDMRHQKGQIDCQITEGLLLQKAATAVNGAYDPGKPKDVEKRTFKVPLPTNPKCGI